MSQAWDKEKILIAWQDSNLWSAEHRAGVLSNELGRDHARDMLIITPFIFIYPA